jgi:hypothetical protein
MKKHILQENYERFFGKREFGDPLPTFEEVMEKHQTNESGILYKAGVKKYGKEGMRKIQQAAGKRKSHAVIGAIKDKYEKGKKESVELSEAIDKTGWKLYKVYDISDKLWMAMKYDLRDQFDELVKIGADYGVFQNAQGTAKILKQIKRLMDKIS